LEKLCDYLYDDLRPRILHEPRLSALCDVCTVLQALMILDVAPPDSSSTEDEEDDDEEAIENATEKAGGLRISQLLEMVLQDAQTRLFFKAQAVVQSDIRYYVPKPEDLAYPEKLIGTLSHYSFHFGPHDRQRHAGPLGPAYPYARKKLLAIFSRSPPWTRKTLGTPPLSA